MPKLPRLTPRKILAALNRAGFYVHHGTGAHINLRHPTKTHLHIVVPSHNRDLAPKTLKSIMAQAEMTLEEYEPPRSRAARYLLKNLSNPQQAAGKEP